MASRLNPYLNFNGNARQALEFYTSVFGGELTLSTFADVTSEMAYQPPAGFAVSLSGDDDALHGCWEKLSAGGTVTMPMQKQVWGDEFGMCTDRFGVPWLINISQPQA